eukprot:7949064-Lingulodinium_polyedra.AAC.1
MLQAMPSGAAGARSSANKQELASFRQTLKEFADPGFLAPRLCEHACLLLPLFEPVGSVAAEVQAVLQHVRPGFESDNTAV